MNDISDFFNINYSLQEITDILLKKNVIVQNNGRYSYPDDYHGYYHHYVRYLITLNGLMSGHPTNDEVFEDFFFYDLIPTPSTLRNFTNANIFSKYLLERDYFDITIKNVADDESQAPAYVNMESGNITFESKLILDMIRQRYFLFALGIFVHNYFVLDGAFGYSQLVDEVLRKAILYIYSFLFYHEISHLIYSPFSSQSFKDLLVTTANKYSDKGLTEQHVHRMSNYISDMYDENQFRFTFGALYFGLINQVYDLARSFTRPFEEVEINSFEDPFEGIQYHTLMQIFTAAPENYTPMTKEVSGCLSIDDVIDRQAAYFDIVMKYFKEEKLLPAKSPEMTYMSSKDSSGGSGEQTFASSERSKEDLDSQEKAEVISKALAEAPPSFSTTFSSIDEFKDLTLPLLVTEFYDTLTSGFTDEWRDYLTKQDAQVDGYLSGKFDYKHAYKTQLTPRVFTKQLGHRRESDLRIKMAIDFSGSMFTDLAKTSRARQKMVSFDPFDLNDHNFDGSQSFMNTAERVVSSSATYCSAFALALSSVFKRAENKVDLAYFSSDFVLLEPFDYDKSNLGRLIDFTMNHRYSGGGTNLMPLLESFLSSFEYITNKDKLIVIVTDGAFGGSSEVLSLIKQGEEAGIFFMFVGIGIYLRDELITSNSDMLAYANGNDMAVRFPADFADFINKKYFTEV